MLNNSGAVAGKRNAREPGFDDCFTQYGEVWSEVSACVRNDPRFFAGKSVHLPCDLRTSAFYRVLKDHFDELGLESVTATAYNSHGHGTIIRNDRYGETLDELEGNGSFDSEECLSIMASCDVIMTNPPFSKMLKFSEVVIGAGKSFSFLANLSHLAYPPIFNAIFTGNAWHGHRDPLADMWFEIEEMPDRDMGTSKRYSYRVDEESTLKRVPSVGWITNIEPMRGHRTVECETMDENIRSNKRFIRACEQQFGEVGYMRYDNYDCIEVPVVSAISSDYDGYMAVPMSYLTKHDPSKFDIVGLWKGSGNGRSAWSIMGEPVTMRIENKYMSSGYQNVNWTGPVLKGRRKYMRLVIRRREEGSEGR